MPLTARQHAVAQHSQPPPTHPQHVACEPTTEHLCELAQTCADNGTTWGDMIGALCTAAAADITHTTLHWLADPPRPVLR